MNNAFGWSLGRREKAKMGGRWLGPRRRGRVRSLSAITIAADNLNAIAVSRGALVRTIAKAVFCFVEYHVFVVGRQAVRV
jgi:hypothetical protein